MMTGDRDYDGSHGGGEKLPDSGYTLKVESTRIDKGLHVGCERKSEIKSDSKDFNQNN